MALSTQITADVANSFVVAVDIQQRLLAAMPEDTGDGVVKQTEILLQAAQILNVPTLVSEQYPKGLGATDTRLQTHLKNANVIEKTCFSCADVDDFMFVLRASHRRQVILTGMEAHICVLQTALDLLGQGFQVFVAEDAVCSRTSQNQQNALHRLRQAGVIITNVESIVFEWLGDAKHPEFKRVSKLII